MKIVDTWDDAVGNANYYVVRVAQDRYVTAKRIIGEDGRTNFIYVMDNEDGTQVHDLNGHTYKDKVDEKAIVRFIRKENCI